VTDLGEQTIVIRRASMTSDRYGAKVRDWAHASVTTVEYCSVQPLNAIENDVDREYANTHMRLYAPAGTDLVATDRVEYGGVTWEVDGEPFHWADPWNPTSGDDHIEADLKRVTG
jgi:hypothetical protein